MIFLRILVALVPALICRIVGDIAYLVGAGTIARACDRGFARLDAFVNH